KRSSAGHGKNGRKSKTTLPGSQTYVENNRCMVLRELSKFAEKAAFFKQDGVDVVTYLPSRKTRTLDHFVVISQKSILQAKVSETGSSCGLSLRRVQCIG